MIQQVERLIQFEPSIAGRKGSDEDIGFGPLWRIVLHGRINRLQHIFGTQSKRADLFGGITQYIEQMRGFFDCYCGGFVLTLAKFAPKTARNEKK